MSKIDLTYTRRWLGMALVIGGAGLVAVHYIDYGWTAHLCFPDHGVVGAILFLIGVGLGIGRPGTRAKPPASGDDQKPTA